jgi:Kinesin motor domain
MMGGSLENSGYSENSNRGLQPRILDSIFEEICKKQDLEPDLEYMVKASYFEIYNENIMDLVS